MIKDLTKGSPGRVLLKYSLPLFGSIIFQQLYNIADSLVAGRYIGTDALAAVGNSYEITLIYIAFAFGCSIGTSVVTARYFGLKDFSALKTTVFTSLMTCAFFAVLLTAAGLIFSERLLEIIKTPAEIFADSFEYINIYIWGFVFLLAYNMSTGIFSALGDSKTPFIFLAVSSVSNVLLDILFVACFDMGVAGVAWATFLCQSVSGAASLLVVLKRLSGLKTSSRPVLFSFRALGKISVIAVPSIIQQAFISFGNIIIQAFINSFGAFATGGYAAAIKLNNMAITSMTALANGMSNYAAQNAGAYRADRIKKGCLSGVVLTCLIAVFFTAVYLLLGRPLVELFISDGNAAAVDAGTSFLNIVTPFYAVVAVKIIVDGVLRGTNRILIFTVSTLTDLFLRVSCAYVFSLAAGLTGIWSAWPVGWIIGTILTCVFYVFVVKKNFGLPPVTLQK